MSSSSAPAVEPGSPAKQAMGAKQDGAKHAMGGKHDKMADCGKMTDETKRAKCESHKTAMEICKDAKGADQKKCISDNMPKMEDMKPGKK
jgi:hypothetical protein